MTTAPARDRFLALLQAAVDEGKLVKLTLGKYRGADPSLRNLFVRPVALQAGPRLSFLWRHATRDVTKNHPPAEALAEISTLLGRDFLDAHLFTAAQSAQLECEPEGAGRLRVTAAPAGESPAQKAGHDGTRSYAIPANAAWLQSLGVTNSQGRPREGMAPKFRQIQKFAELVGHLVQEAGLGTESLRVVDMGCGKGYLTFAVSALLGEKAQVRGIESRPELVALCNRVAAEQGFAPRLAFAAGQVADAPLEKPDLVIALHACDTATDDALARAVGAEARLILVSPCCQKELRPLLTAPPVLADALRHGILQERQAEFVTDALRAQLLEWAGYRTRVFEFVSTEHTARNLMIAAIRSHPPGDPGRAARLRAFASFYGIRRQSLARQLGFDLAAG